MLLPELGGTYPNGCICSFWLIWNTDSYNTQEEWIRGVLDTDVCPTISCSSWQNNCFLIEICTSEQEMPWWTLHQFVGGDVQGPIRKSWILRHSIQHHYKSWQFTSLRNSRRMDKVKNNRGGGESSRCGVRSKHTEVSTERASARQLALPTFRSQE